MNEPAIGKIGAPQAEIKGERQGPDPSPWGAAAGAGVMGGLIAGLIAAYGSGKLGMGAFVVFIFMVAGINGGGRRALAMVLFPLVAALVVSLVKG
jgi:hypothetical protein